MAPDTFDQQPGFEPLWADWRLACPCSSWGRPPFGVAKQPSLSAQLTPLLQHAIATSHTGWPVTPWVQYSHEGRQETRGSGPHG